MPLSPATTLQHRYRIVRTIGSGGMGTVYLAEDLRLGGRFCAVKEHRPDPSMDAVDLAKLRRQFEQREARILAELDHPNLPKVFDYFNEGGNDYLAMDYVAGDTLHMALARHMEDLGQPLSETVVLNWAGQVLDALHYLHTRPSGAIIHRDIKPANVILTKEGRIKLVDFGLAKLIASPSAAAASSSIQLLTPEYAPPEQFIASLGPMDERSDIFSLGATLYHLLTGMPPPNAQERAFGAAVMVPANQQRWQVCAATGEVLMRACALKKEDRYHTAAEWLAVLGKARSAESKRPSKLVVHVKEQRESFGARASSPYPHHDRPLAAGLSHVGQVRTRNEDRFSVPSVEATVESLDHYGRLFAVADGMGGHSGGDVASQIVIDTLIGTFYAPSSDDVFPRLQRAVDAANEAVVQGAAADPNLADMGATLTAVALHGQSPCMATLAHVGDSRAYLIRDGAISQISEEHTFFAEAIRTGTLTEAEAAVHPNRHAITRAMGRAGGIQAYYGQMELQPGDRLVLCTAGLTHAVSDNEILQNALAFAPDVAVQHLVTLANERGGLDNVTAVLVALPGCLESSGSWQRP